MSQTKIYIVAFLMCLSSVVFGQKTNDSDVDLLKMRIESYITQAGFESERGDFYNAKDNLEKEKYQEEIKKL